MRGLIFLTLLGFAAFWAYDQYKFNGQYTRAVWQEAKVDSQNFRSEMQRLINNAMSGR
jgi:hypothetical protein